MFGENTALLIAWLSLGLGIINLVWNLFKFLVERRDKVKVRLSIGGNSGGISITATNLGQVPRFFDSASIIWKEKASGSFLDRLLDYVGLVGSYSGIPFHDSSNSKEEPTAVMDCKKFDCPLDRISDLEELLKTKKKIGIQVTCRDGGFHWDFHGIHKELLRMSLDWYKRAAYGPKPQDRKEEKPNQQPKAETPTLTQRDDLP